MTPSPTAKVADAVCQILAELQHGGFRDRDIEPIAQRILAAIGAGGQAVAGCVCQDQHRRGYCTEPGCPYALAHPSPAIPVDEVERVLETLLNKIEIGIDPLDSRSDRRAYDDARTLLTRLRAGQQEGWRDLPVAEETISYIKQYGGRCRDCADAFGVCPTRGLPCDNG